MNDMLLPALVDAEDRRAPSRLRSVEKGDERNARTRMALVGGFPTLAGEGIALLLGQHAPEMSICATMSIGDAVGYLRAASTPYDAALLSVSGTDARDMDTIFDLARDPQTPPIVLALSAVAPETAARLLATGIRGIVDETADGRILAGVLRLVMAGGTYVPNAAPPEGTGNMLPSGPCGDLLRQCCRRLTPKQLEVLALLGRGYGNKVIAKRLALVESTIKAHVVGILRVLGLENRTQAALFAARVGLLAVPPALRSDVGNRVAAHDAENSEAA